MQMQRFHLSKRGQCESEATFWLIEWTEASSRTHLKVWEPKIFTFINIVYQNVIDKLPENNLSKFIFIILILWHLLFLLLPHAPQIMQIMPKCVTHLNTSTYIKQIMTICKWVSYPPPLPPPSTSSQHLSHTAPQLSSALDWRKTKPGRQLEPTHRWCKVKQNVCWQTVQANYLMA